MRLSRSTGSSTWSPHLDRLHRCCKRYRRGIACHARSVPRKYHRFRIWPRFAPTGVVPVSTRERCGGEIWRQVTFGDPRIFFILFFWLGRSTVPMVLCLRHRLISSGGGRAAGLSDKHQTRCHYQCSYTGRGRHLVPEGSGKVNWQTCE